MAHITRKKLSEVMGVTLLTLRNWETSGKLNPIKSDYAGVMYKGSEVEKLITDKFEKLRNDLDQLNNDFETKKEFLEKELERLQKQCVIKKINL